VMKTRAFMAAPMPILPHGGKLYPLFTGMEDSCERAGMSPAAGG
jgi:hypothetical protein